MSALVVSKNRRFLKIATAPVACAILEKKFSILASDMFSNPSGCQSHLTRDMEAPYAVDTYCRAVSEIQDPLS